MFKKIGNVLKFGAGKKLKKYEETVKAVNDLEKDISVLTDSQLAAKTIDFKQRYEKGQKLDDLMPEAFAAVREVAKRTLNMRHFDVQILGGVGLLQHDMPTAEKKYQYQSDVIHGTNNEFGFDYLRDNMVMSKENMVQDGHYYAIVDEVDSILIDEARTPLIISGVAYGTTEIYRKFAQIVPQLKIDEDFEIDEKLRTAAITEAGVEKVERIMGIDNLYDPRNYLYIHALNQSLRAYNLFKKDVDYMLKDGEVLIVDEFTGRLMIGRRYSEGLHPAHDTKKGVRVQRESQTLASVTFQNFFR